MCPTRSYSRWIFLLTVAVVMLVSVQKAGSYYIALSCCRRVSTREIETIKSCYEQKPRYGCSQHAFLINKRCIDPNSEWLLEKLEKGKLNCPPVIST